MEVEINAQSAAQMQSHFESALAHLKSAFEIARKLESKGQLIMRAVSGAKVQISEAEAELRVLENPTRLGAQYQQAARDLLKPREQEKPKARKAEKKYVVDRAVDNADSKCGYSIVESKTFPSYLTAKKAFDKIVAKEGEHIFLGRQNGTTIDCK